MYPNGEDTIGRRQFLKDGLATAVRLGCLPAGFKYLGQLGARPAASTIHNFLIIGTNATFLYQLPVFSFKGYDSPHRYQVIMAATFTQSGRDLNDAFAVERSTHPLTRMYSFNPQQPFALPSLTQGLVTIKGTIFQGHLERGGKPIFNGVQAKINKVVYFEELVPGASRLKQLEYILFGRGSEIFMAHRLSGPPDFDQIISLKGLDPRLTDDDLAKGPNMVFSSRGNILDQRIRDAKASPAVIPRFRSPAKIIFGKEEYFEEGELLVPPTFAPTTAEKQAGFGT